MQSSFGNTKADVKSFENEEKVFLEIDDIQEGKYAVSGGSHLHSPFK